MLAVDEQLVEVVFEVLAAFLASMPIVDSKELSPYSFFLDVESNANSILVVVSRYALMSIDCIAFYQSILL